MKKFLFKRGITNFEFIVLALVVGPLVYSNPFGSKWNVIGFVVWGITIALSEFLNYI